MRKVFVASSFAALQHAETISELLTREGGVEVLPWKEFFDAGYVNLESLDRAYREVAGALILLTPDHEVAGENGALRLSRPNVVFEMGLFGARLGWGNVMICTFDEVHLPTDLDGMFYIRLGKYPGHDGGLSVPTRALESLQRWTNGLLDVPGNVPRTELFHGYSGEWRAEIHFERWVNHEVRDGEVADVQNGSLHLMIPESGAEGQGWFSGEVEVDISHGTPPKHYGASYRASDVIYAANCSQDGVLTMKSISSCRFRLHEDGERWFQKDISQERPGSRRYEWELHPVEGKSAKLVGTYLCEKDTRSIGRVTLTRL
jgi:hypothetical protein